MPGRSPETAGDRRMNSKSRILYLFFTAKNARTSVRCNIFFIFSYPSHLKHQVLRAFLEDCLPEMLSNVGVLAERSMNKSKKHRAIAPAALGGCGGLGQLWEALAELWEALGELWEGLYIEKLPINRTSSRYVTGGVTIVGGWGWGHLNLGWPAARITQLSFSLYRPSQSSPRASESSARASQS